MVAGILSLESQQHRDWLMAGALKLKRASLDSLTGMQNARAVNMRWHVAEFERMSLDYWNRYLLLEQSAELLPRLHDGDYTALPPFFDLVLQQEGKRRRVELKDQHPRAGDSLRGKSVLVYPASGNCDGFGNQIQLVRYADALRSMGAGKLIMEVRPELIDLFRQIDYVDEFVPYDAALPATDFAIPFTLLPAACGTNLQNIPACPYLLRQLATTERWREKLGPKSEQFRVGLVWSGKVDEYTHVMGDRWIKLNQLAPLLATSGIEFVSIRKGMSETEVRALSAWPNVRHIGDEFKDFSDTAGAIDLCDLIITIDGSVAHLAGAMGKPVWMLLIKHPFYFFGLEGDTTPWYPSARLFRQSEAGDWAPVVEEVRGRLAEIGEGGQR